MTIDRAIHRTLLGAVILACFAVTWAGRAADGLPPPLTIPHAQRPAWVSEQGIVMFGNWEPFTARVKVDTGGYVPDEAMIRRYEREHGSETLQALKEAGVNFVMTHCYKGAGLATEMPDMEFTKDFIRRCHEAGFHVGVYASSGTIYPERINKEVPASRDWPALDAAGYATPYGGLTFRVYLNRNNPDSQNYLKRVVDYAVNEMKVDLLHFDNFVMPPGYDKVSVGRFRDYLRAHGTPADYGLANFDSAMPPAPHSPPPSASRPWPGYYTRGLGAKPDTPLGRAWLDFGCESIALSFHELAEHARSQRSDVLLECNAGGIGGRLGPPIDHARLMRYGEAFWDESSPAVYKKGAFNTHIRTYRMAQTMDQMMFSYMFDPTTCAEALAYNIDCLGCLDYSLDEQLVILPTLLPYVRFFHEKRPYYRDAARVPDIAILRDFASQVYAASASARATYRFEDHLIRSRTPWAMIFDQHLADLKPYRALCLVGSDALSEAQVRQVREYAAGGGGLILTEETGQNDENMKPREKNPFADIEGPRIARVKADADFADAMAAFRKAYGGELSIAIDGLPSLLAEMTEQPREGRRLVHLVNYDGKTPVGEVKVNARVPGDWQIKQAVLLRPERPEPQRLPFRQEGDRVTFTVPGVDAYALIALETQ